MGLVRSVTQIAEHELEPLLDHLRLADFVFEVPAFPEAEYTFKHALTQEVAYNSVLTERRKSLHERAGRAIESLYASRLEDHFDRLAYHYSRSDNAPKAVEYLRLASAQALGLFHYDEAIAHAAAALKFIGILPGGPDRLRTELALQLISGQASMATIGYGALEVDKALRRSEEISREIGSAVEMFPVLSGLCTYHLAHAGQQPAEGTQLAVQTLGNRAQGRKQRSPG